MVMEFRMPRWRSRKLTGNECGERAASGRISGKPVSKSNSGLLLTAVALLTVAQVPQTIKNTGIIAWHP